MPLSFTSLSEKLAWGLLGLLIFLLVAYVLYAFVGALVVGVFLYYAIRPVDRRLDDRTEHPSLNAMVTIAVVGVPILLVLGYAALVGLRELEILLGTGGLDQLRQSLTRVLRVVSSTDQQGLRGFLRNNLSQLRQLATTALTWFLRLFVIATVAYYLLRDDRKIARWGRDTFDDYPAVVAFLERVDDDLSTIYTGNLLTIAATGIIAALVFYGLDMVAPSAAGVRYPVLLGLLVGVATLIPAVGMKLVYLPYTAYLFWQSWRGAGMPLWFPVAFLVVTAVLVDFVPDFFIRSYLSAGEMNMGLLLLTYVLAAIAFGWYGVFLGPIILTAFTNFTREILPRLIEPSTSPRE